jgi:hypothetical protein
VSLSKRVSGDERDACTGGHRLLNGFAAGHDRAGGQRGQSGSSQRPDDGVAGARTLFSHHKGVMPKLFRPHWPFVVQRVSCGRYQHEAVGGERHELESVDVIDATHQADVVLAAL